MNDISWIYLSIGVIVAIMAVVIVALIKRK